MEKSQEKSENAHERLAHLETIKKMLKEEMTEIEERMDEVTQDRSKNGGAFFELEEKVKETAKEVAKFKTQATLKASAIKDDEENLAVLHSNLKDAQQSHLDAQKKSSDLAQNCDIAVKEYEEMSLFIKNTESLVQTLTTGLGSSEGQENGYMDQLQGLLFS